MVYKKYGIIRFIFVAILVFCFQVLTYQLSVFLFSFVARALPDVDYYYLLMIHHIIEFLLVFIPTIILHYVSKLDFGYHIKDLLKGMKWFLIGTIFSLIVSLINALIGEIMDFNLSYFLFQLCFSGLGEEVLYRSIPLVIFVIAYGKETIIKINNKIAIDFGVIVSALLFSLAHISFQFGQPGIYFSINQLIVSFIMGIILGYAYKRTNSVWFCMIIHSVYNVLNGLFPFIFGLF